MDVISLSLGNALLGNNRDAAALEWAITGGALQFHSETRFVLTGAVAVAALNDSEVVPNVIYRARPHDVLEVARFVHGRFVYLSLAGGIDVAPVLGARSTYLPAEFGGLAGRRLAAGDELGLGKSEMTLPAAGVNTAEGSNLPDTLGDEPIGVVPAVEAAATAELLSAEFRVSAQSDRTGYRLEGTRLTATGDPAAFSEPACAGMIQLPPSGTPIVLMADAPTLGGYPRIAVVASVDVCRLAQRTPGETVTFRTTDVHSARQAARAWRTEVDRIRALTRHTINP